MQKKKKPKYSLNKEEINTETGSTLEHSYKKMLNLNLIVRKRYQAT